MEDWKNKKVKCIDPVETDMFMDEVYDVKRDYGTDVCININGLDRLYNKTRFTLYVPEEDDKISI
jgi:hypothetical protein